MTRSDCDSGATVRIFTELLVSGVAVDFSITLLQRLLLEFQRLLRRLIREVGPEEVGGISQFREHRNDMVNARLR